MFKKFYIHFLSTFMTDLLWKSIYSSFPIYKVKNIGSVFLVHLGIYFYTNYEHEIAFFASKFPIQLGKRVECPENKGSSLFFLLLYKSRKK